MKHTAPMMKTEDSLLIRNRGRRLDNLQIGGLVVFWILWTCFWIPLTVLTILNMTKYPLIRILPGLLLFAVADIVVVLIPWLLIAGRRTQKLISTGNCLRVEGTLNPLEQTISIERDKLQRIFFGYPPDNFSWPRNYTFCTVDLFELRNGRSHPVRLAKFLHPKETRKVFNEVYQFLLRNGF